MPHQSNTSDPTLEVNQDREQRNRAIEKFISNAEINMVRKKSFSLMKSREIERDIVRIRQLGTCASGCRSRRTRLRITCSGSHWTIWRRRLRQP